MLEKFFGVLKEDSLVQNRLRYKNKEVIQKTKNVVVLDVFTIQIFESPRL